MKLISGIFSLKGWKGRGGEGATSCNFLKNYCKFLTTQETLHISTLPINSTKNWKLPAPNFAFSKKNIYIYKYISNETAIFHQDKILVPLPVPLLYAAALTYMLTV